MGTFSYFAEIGECPLFPAGLHASRSGSIYDKYIRDASDMKTAKLFKNGESQAVRLPKEFRFQGTEVLIKRVGDAVVLLPAAGTWDTLVESLAKFPDDFLVERSQPVAPDTREEMA